MLIFGLFLYHKTWSGWRDSNSRHPAPKAGALPGYATPRTRKYSLISSFGQISNFFKILTRFIKLNDHSVKIAD